MDIQHKYETNNNTLPKKPVQCNNNNNSPPTESKLPVVSIHEYSLNHDSMRDDWDNCHFFLIFCQILLPKNLTIMREIGQNLIRKTMYVTILIKIGLTYSKLMNKMLIFLWIFLNNMNSLLDLHSPIKMLININWSLRQNPGLFLPFRNQFLSKITY